MEISLPVTEARKQYFPEEVQELVRSFVRRSVAKYPTYKRPKLLKQPFDAHDVDVWVEHFKRFLTQNPTANKKGNGKNLWVDYCFGSRKNPMFKFVFAKNHKNAVEGELSVSLILEPTGPKTMKRGGSTVRVSSYQSFKIPQGGNLIKSCSEVFPSDIGNTLSSRLKVSRKLPGDDECFKLVGIWQLRKVDHELRYSLEAIQQAELDRSLDVDINAYVSSSWVTVTIKVCNAFAEEIVA